MKLLSGEFLLDHRANGGTVVALRSLWVTLLGFSAVVLLKEILNPQSTFVFSAASLHETVYTSLPIAAAILAGAYTALYARFASQWTYLANVYNQLMAAKVRGVGQGDETQRALIAWQAGFIEDAEELHLARKPMFAGVIDSLLADQAVRSWYVSTTVGGLDRLTELEAKVRKALASASIERQSSRPTAVH